MSDLWSGIIIGAAISIPVGIGVNLASGKIERARARHNEKAAEKLRKRDEAFEQMAQACAGSQDRYARVMFWSLQDRQEDISTGLFILMIAGLSYLVGSSIANDAAIESATRLAVMICTALAGFRFYRAMSRIERIQKLRARIQRIELDAASSRQGDRASGTQTPATPPPGPEQAP